MGLETTELAATLINPDRLKDREIHIQVISSELMSALNNAANTDNSNVEIEVVSRLLATIIEPNAFGFSPNLDKITRKKFIESQAKIERKMNQKAWDQLFEIEKLELYLRLKSKMSKKYVENFTVIDVEKETSRIQAILDEENQQEKD